MSYKFVFLSILLPVFALNSDEVSSNQTLYVFGDDNQVSSNQTLYVFGDGNQISSKQSGVSSLWSYVKNNPLRSSVYGLILSGALASLLETFGGKKTDIFGLSSLYRRLHYPWIYPYLYSDLVF